MSGAMPRERIEVYCDERRPELFVTTHRREGKAVIGSLWMPASFRATLKHDIAMLRNEHGVWGEFKWKKVSPSKIAFYLDLIDYFCSQNDLRFRVIVVDASLIDLDRFHESDAELGFYKFYYQLLTHWIDAASSYAILCDDKVNRDPRRLPVLKRVLARTNRSSTIESIQAVDSHQSVAVQLCDVLIGATQWRMNGSIGSSTAKASVVNRIETRIRRRIGATYPSERKFNVFNIELGRRRSEPRSA